MVDASYPHNTEESQAPISTRKDSVRSLKQARINHGVIVVTVARRQQQLDTWESGVG